VSRFHVLCSRTRFRRYRGLRVPFSCFARPDSFSTVLIASGLDFMFCAPGLVFGGIEGVGSRLYVFAPGLVFGGAVGVSSRFHVFRSRTCFRRYRGRQVPFPCFALPNSLSAVPWASGPVFIFCAPELVFDGTEGVKSRFHVFCSRTCSGWGPLVDVDQWESATWHSAADVTQSGTAMWHCNSNRFFF
jgi:hypothetical protein